ncbi:Decaprenylphosphoryl-2-keto-beta-D-erythro-pentose reductase [Xanthomonas sacchari]|uniref:SDR family oxidoreductase n=1 Tax=Xanthomonas sacchari TaxID=56458 RepID=UPI00225481A8|nr:SDR family oxidoreductase [Xanthomonas sacchari]MCW0378494.1 Decaprenylphosphoryl-2-keto-beta-D-erythro-pentose reductase [Xanthomonas sacchari]MCW0453135.1 Decaprenylphosphoryl-2-keto-beta-D-erythro-pentose reductase [Xanthomonas sacchari]
MQRVLIIGATSAIAEAVARRYAQRGAMLALVGRNVQRLEATSQDLRARGAPAVTVHILDVNRLEDHATCLDAASQALDGAIDVALIAHGTLPDQADCTASVEYALHEFSTNGTSAIALSIRLAQKLTSGSTLAVISSVAGDRGRSSNYLYGSAKAAVTTFLSGLGQQLRSKGINVLTIKPGFVDTPMTAQFKKGALWATPDRVARGILRSIDRKRSVAYLPGFWRFIMAVITHIPETVFRRIKL